MLTSSGLIVTINVNEAEYISQVGSSVGARVVVHKYQTMPFPEDQGILTRPGELVSLGIKKVSSIGSLQ